MFYGLFFFFILGTNERLFPAFFFLSFFLYLKFCKIAVLNQTQIIQEIT